MDKVDLSKQSMVSLLFVDSDEKLCKEFSERFSKTFSGLITATSAEDALISAGSLSIDILVTDVALDGMSGLELISLIRDKNPSCFVIVTTADTSVECFQRLIEKRVDKFIKKPFSFDELEKELVASAHHAFVLKFYHEDGDYGGILDSSAFDAISFAIDCIREGQSKIEDINPTSEHISANSDFKLALDALKNVLKHR